VIIIVIVLVLGVCRDKEWIIIIAMSIVVLL